MQVKWTLKYKDEFTHGNWATCSYLGDEYVTEDFLKDFWGVDECEEYEITKEVLID